MADRPFTACTPFAGLAVASGARAGVIATDRDGLGLATVAVRKGQFAALYQRVQDRYGIELPRGPYRREANGVAFAGTGPETWLATKEKGAIDFAAALRDEIGALASVSNQSDGYAVLRLTGPNVRATLAKLIPIDVHPREFKPGDLASTVASHMGATIWRLDDAAHGAPVFEIAVFRSLAGSFWQVLSASAAEFGIDTIPHDVG